MPAQECVDVRELRILDGLFSKRRHLTGRMPHVLHQLRIGDRARRQPRPGTPSLRFVAMALIAAEADEQLASVRGVPLRDVGILLRRSVLRLLSRGLLCGDGDFMYAPGVWWTAAHHKIPLLAVMHNNRAYHQEVMHVQRMGNRHNRGVTRAHIGTTLEDPFINFAQIVKGMGVYSEGPITNPNDLGPALKRALDVVKKGEPALVDVVTQPR